MEDEARMDIKIQGRRREDSWLQEKSSMEKNGGCGGIRDF